MMLLLSGMGLFAPPALAQDAEETAEDSAEESAPCDPEEAGEEGCPEEEEAEPEGPPTPEYGYFTTTLDNGLKVSVLSDPDHPVVATQTWVQVGSAHEAASEAGFAHLFEHFMFGDTSNYDKDVYSRHHTSNGGTENAYTAFDNTVYISEIPPEQHDRVLQLEADRLVNLVLDQENLDNEKKIVTEELRLRTENNPTGRLLITGLRGLFGEHPYGHSPAGTKEDIQGADLELARKFYEGYYRPANLHLVIVGPVNGPWTLERVAEYYGDLPEEHTVPPEVPSLQDWTFPERVDLQDDIPPVKLAAHIYIAPAPGDPDYWAMKLLGQMLSSGSVDRFREELVVGQSKALDGFGMYVDQFQSGGLMLFGSISLPTRSRRRALKLIDGTVDTLNERAWLTEENLAVARRALLRQELEGSYYASSQADDIGRAYAWMGDDALGVEGFAARYEAVTLKDVEKVWARYIATAQPVEFTVKKGKPE